MIGFKQFLEALDLKTVKELKLTRKTSKAYSIPKLNEIFNGKDRITIDSDFRMSLDDVKSDAWYYIYRGLSQLGYEITKAGYVDNVTWKKDDVNKKQLFKIGRLLQKHYPTFEDMFKKDKIREMKADAVYKIVISRHPYDVAGMSTGRSWTSCTHLPQKSNDKTGVYCHLVSNAAREGTLIAYLVPISDNNISKPLSRSLLVPHIGSKDVVYNVSAMYGVKYDKFQSVVFDWVKNNLNNELKSDEYFHPPNIYDDDFSLYDFNKVPWTKQKFKSLLDNIHPNIQFNYFNDRISYLITFDLTPLGSNIKYIGRNESHFSSKIMRLIPLNVGNVAFTESEALVYGDIYMPNKDTAVSGTTLEDMYRQGMAKIKDSKILEFSYKDTLKKIINMDFY